MIILSKKSIITYVILWIESRGYETQLSLNSFYIVETLPTGFKRLLQLIHLDEDGINLIEDLGRTVDYDFSYQLKLYNNLNQAILCYRLDQRSNLNAT